MAFTVQNPEGTVENANAYTDPDALKVFALDRGSELVIQTDEELQVAIILATDFLDSAFQFVGTPKGLTQGTAFPRVSVPSASHRGLPPALIKACMQLALRAANGLPLMSDPVVDPSGQTVSALTVKVGPIEKSTTFAAAPGGAQGVSASQLSRRFPDVELGLRQAGLLGGASSGNGVGRLARA